MTVVAVFGDTAPPAQGRIAEAAARVRPEAVVFLGDAVDQHGRWSARRGLRRWVRDMTPLRDRLFAIAGNHDFDAGGDLSGYMAALEELGCGPARRGRFRLDLEGLVLLGLTVPHGANAVAPEDLRWCEESFATAAAGAARVVAVHQPLFPIAGRIGISLDADPRRRDELLASMRAWRVDVVVSGHEHLYARRWIADGVLQIAAGGGGARSERAVFGHADHTANQEHFVVLVPGDGTLGVEARSADGDLLDRFSLEIRR